MPELNAPAKKSAQHEMFAKEIADRVCNEFNPIEQNEFIEVLINSVREDRLCLIKTAEEKHKYLSDTFEYFNSIKRD